MPQSPLYRRDLPRLDPPRRDSDSGRVPEMRKNVVTGELVIVAPERARRPRDTVEAAPEIPAYAENCPFCPGQESETPPPTYVGEVDGLWAARVVPNKFSALAPDGEPWSQAQGLMPRGGAAGPHEVIIEGRNHGARFWQMPADVRWAVLHAWHHRLTNFYARPAVKHVVLFKNHGPAAGGSLTHPHSQIVGLPAVPGRFEHRRMIAIQHEMERGSCLMCDLLAEERAGPRLVAETEDYAAFVPFAAFSPLHVWIVPKAHAGSFASVSAEARVALDAILSPVLQAVDGVGRQPDFNLMVLGGHPRSEGDRASHWYLSIVGRTTKAAGFELGTGMYINPSSPEAQARALRAALPRE